MEGEQGENHTFMWRPACLIIHTGVRSTSSPLAALSSRGSSEPIEVLSTDGFAACLAVSPVFNRAPVPKSLGYESKNMILFVKIPNMAMMARKGAEQCKGKK
eukprot:1132778-Rhodomonas_salina.1